jgi:hypothetical protein
MHNVLNSIVKIKKLIANPLVFLLGLGLFHMGCQNIQYPERPKDLIPEDKMVEVLIDVHLFNAAKSVNRLPLQQTGMTPHQFIYEKHDIDSIQYEKSNAFYGAHLNRYERIHSRVKDFLENKKTEIDTVIVREKRKQDSIKIITDSIRLKKIGVDTNKEPAVLRKVAPVKTDSIN